MPRLACAKLYDRKTPITAADLLNDRVVPFFDEHEVKLLRVLTDRGSEYCGNPETHEYELYLAVEDIDHTRTKTKSPQTNGIVERFHKTMLNEFYRVAFRKKIYLDRRAAGRPRYSGSPATTAHHNTHLAISLKGRGFAGRDAIPRGVLGSAVPAR